MKKALIIQILFLFVFCIATTAFAAPSTIFSDVPAGHWAYKAVKELAKDGIIDGYGDGTFRGDRTMTRYEMAMIVADAVSKEDKANAQDRELIQKLANEFSTELGKIDKRLTKVEDNTRLHLSGTVQFYAGSSSARQGSAWPSGNLTNHTWAGERIRLFVNAPSSDGKFVFNARLYQQDNNLQNPSLNDSAYITGNSPNVTKWSNKVQQIAFDRFYVTVKDTLDGSLTVGKNALYLGKWAFTGYTGNFNGVTYAHKTGFLTTTLGEGNIGATGKGEAAFAQFNYKPDKANDLGAYVYQNNAGAAKVVDVFGLVDVGGGMGIQFEAARNNYSRNKETGYIVSLLSKGETGESVPQNNSGMTSPSKVNDSAWALSYRHMPDGVAGAANIGAGTSFLTILSDTAGAYPNTFDNINAWGFDYQWIPIKNTMLTMEYNHITPIKTGPTNNYVVGSFTFFF